MLNSPSYPLAKNLLFHTPTHIPYAPPPCSYTNPSSGFFGHTPCITNILFLFLGGELLIIPSTFGVVGPLCISGDAICVNASVVLELTFKLSMFNCVAPEHGSFIGIHNPCVAHHFVKSVLQHAASTHDAPPFVFS